MAKQDTKTGKGEIETLLRENYEKPINHIVDLLDAFLEQQIAERIEELEKKNIELTKEIAKRKQIEETLLQSRKLRSIGIIIAGISHEFNNILAIISGNVQLLEVSYHDHEELTDTLSIIKKATDNGAAISGKMLEFTKTERNSKGFAPYDIRVQIKEAIDFTMPKWKTMARDNGVNYHFDEEGIKDVPAILCNPAELREVFIHIINNAMDAMSDGGRISFSTWSNNDMVFVSIADTGHGMNEDEITDIFDPFYTTRRPEKTGLGMSSSYSTIIRHGGEIMVKSELGKGSTFHLQFPAASKVDYPEKSPETGQETESKDIRILVVDNEQDICDILDNFLSKSGYLVRTVDNGAEAIILTRIDDYDLVLCDLAMPEVSGYDVIKELNKLKDRPKIGIITGWGENLKFLDEGLKFDFIAKKPFDFLALLENTNEVLGPQPGR